MSAKLQQKFQVFLTNVGAGTELFFLPLRLLTKKVRKIAPQIYFFAVQKSRTFH
jgi:hypothetical protein